MSYCLEIIDKALLGKGVQVPWFFSLGLWDSSSSSSSSPFFKLD